MESIPHDFDPIANDQGGLDWRWRLYLLNKDNQFQSDAAWTPTAGLADGAVASTAVQVTGAALNDIALATHDKIGANDVLISAFVQAAGVVRVMLINKTGAPLSIAAGTVYVTILRRQ